MRLPILNIRINNIDCVAIISIRSPQSLLSKSFKTRCLKSTIVLPPISSVSVSSEPLNNERKKSEFVVLYPYFPSRSLGCSFCHIPPKVNNTASLKDNPSSCDQAASSSNSDSNTLTQCKHYRVIVVEEIIAAVQADLEIPAGPQRFSVVNELPLGLESVAACILGYDFFEGFDLNLDLLGVFVDVWNKHAQLNLRTGLPLHPEKSSTVLLSKSNWHRNFVSQAVPKRYIVLGEADEEQQIANPQYTKAQPLDLIEKWPSECSIDLLLVVPDPHHSCNLQREFATTLGCNAKFWLEHSLETSRERIKNRAMIPDLLTWRALTLSVTQLSSAVPSLPNSVPLRSSVVSIYAALLVTPPLFVDESGRLVDSHCNRPVCQLIDRCTCIQIVPAPADGSAPTVPPPPPSRRVSPVAPPPSSPPVTPAAQAQGAAVLQNPLASRFPPGIAPAIPLPQVTPAHLLSRASDGTSLACL